MSINQSKPYMLFCLFSFFVCFCFVLFVCFVLTMAMSETCVRCSSVYVLLRIVCGFVLSTGHEQSFEMCFAGDRPRSF